MNQDLFYAQSQMDSETPVPAEEGEKKKKKKKKNKKKNKGGEDISEVQSQSDLSMAEMANLVDEVAQGESFNNKTQGTSHVLGSIYEDDFEPLRDVLSESFYEDEDSSEDEGMPDYKLGGYHPIHVGEILMDRYVIIQKLGWGHFSTVWLTKDLRYNSYVAIKVQKSAQHYVEAAYDEVDILDQVAQNWKTEEWKRSIKEYYKNDKHLMSRLDKFGVISESSHCA